MNLGGKVRQISVLEASPVYIVSSRIAKWVPFLQWVSEIHWETLSHKNKQMNKIFYPGLTYGFTFAYLHMHAHIKHTLKLMMIAMSYHSLLSFAGQEEDAVWTHFASADQSWFSAFDKAHFHCSRLEKGMYVKILGKTSVDFPFHYFTRIPRIMT